MKKKQIFFTAPRKAELWEVDVPAVGADDVQVRMEYTVVSGGTERANIMAMPNAGGNKFPKSLGYCGVGRVMQIGSEVTNISVGDRVLVYHGNHMKYNVTPESDVTKVENDANFVA